jgi:hypothetical protein
LGRDDEKPMPYAEAYITFCCNIIGWNAVLTVSLKRNVSLHEGEKK